MKTRNHFRQCYSHVICHFELKINNADNPVYLFIYLLLLLFREPIPFLHNLVPKSQRVCFLFRMPPYAFTYLHRSSLFGDSHYLLTWHHPQAAQLFSEIQKLNPTPFYFLQVQYRECFSSILKGRKKITFLIPVCAQN